MPTYEITAPDGKVLEITAPDGATQEQVLAYAQAQYKPGGASFAGVRGGVQSTESRAERDATGALTDWGQRVEAQRAADRAAYAPTGGFGGNFVAGMGRSVAETGRGVKQIGAAVLDAIPGVDLTDARQRMDADIAESRRLDAPLMGTAGGQIGNVTGAALQAAVPVGGVAGRASAALGRAAPYAGAAARGAAFAGAQPVIGDESRGLNAAMGGALGAAGQGVATGLARGAAAAKEAVNPVVQRSIEAARAAGIPLHMSQVTDSRFLKGLGAVLNNLPFTGAAKANRAQQEAFNRAVGRTFGADASTLTDDVMTQARQGIGSVYDSIFARNNVALDQATINRMLMVEREAARNLTEDQARVVSNQFQRIIDEFADGPITGQKYQSLRGALADVADESTMGRAVKGLRTALDGAAHKSVGPADAATLKQANSMWANLRTAEKALQQVEGAKGNVRPASLYPLLRGGSTREMRELAQVGQNVLKEQIPNSGTPERQMILNLLGLGGGAAGVGAATGTLPLLAKLAGTGLVAGRVMNSPMAASAVLASRPARIAAQSGLARLAQGATYALPAIPSAVAAADEPLEINVVGGRAGPAPTAAELEALRRRGRSP